MSPNSPVYVTQPHLPPLEEFVPFLKEIWANKILTNGGPFHVQLEAALCAYLGVEHLSLFANATIGLVTALQALRISGEVITTPYSFVATAHSLLWNGIKPVFVDIDPVTLTLDPARLEAAITPQTTAIMPVHVYGRPCDVQAIQEIADRHGLKVIYDAAHAFGVRDASGASVMLNGDLSVLSFHATKVFTTFEGGAIVCRDARIKKHIDHLKNFGFVDEVTVAEPGINGKMSEVNAAFGVLQLQHIDRALALRQQVDAIYRKRLKGIAGLQCVTDAGERANYGYFPILVGDEYPLSRDALFQKFRDEDIYVRRYFYPLISDFPMYSGLPSANRDNLPVATRAAQQILCLPIYPALEMEQIDRIVALLAV